MTLTPDQVFAAALELPREKRHDLALLLWPPEEADVDNLHPAFVAELDRRWNEHLSDPTKAIPADVVIEEMRRKYAL